MATTTTLLLAAMSAATMLSTAPRPDWQAKIDAADALFTPDDAGLPLRSAAGLANGVLGTVINTSVLHLAGVFSNSSRASLSSPLPAVWLAAVGAHQQSPLVPEGALLDLREATYTRRYSGSLTPAPATAAAAAASAAGAICGSDHRYSVEQRWFAHRATPSLFVMELALEVPCGCPWRHNISLRLMASPAAAAAAPATGLNFSRVETSEDGTATISVGTTSKPEGGSLSKLRVATVATQLPSSITIPAAQRCGSFSRRYVVAVRTSRTAAADDDVVAAARRDYAAAMGASADGLWRSHVAEWARIWRSGLEIGGRRDAALVLNSSLYTVLSSLRDDYPFSCCGTGLYSNGWNGVAFWDCEMWHEPSLLLLHPNISRSMRQYRANNLQRALENAAAHSLPGAKWPWESTASGYHTPSAP
jgi:hypothetical protein